MEGVRSTQRNAQLDAMRAFAIGIVMIHHYLNSRFFLSGFGATLFFVLSGFFATRTLVKMKAGMEAGQTRPGLALKHFYLKRWMRLWPLYYLVLALTLAFNVENARSSFFWNATFASNIQVLMNGDWSGRFSPLWSLSVLEQFYLVWPAFVLACPKKYLLPSVLALIVMAPLYRFGCYLADASPYYWCVMPVASFDQLGCGALLALCVEKVVAPKTAGVIFGVAGKFFAPLFVVLLLCKGFRIEPPFCAVYIGTVASVAFLWLAGWASTGIGGPVGRLMQNRFLSHVGTMSYSIFLFHNFTELLVPKSDFLSPIMDSNYRAVILIPLTIFLAYLAWRFIESPMLSIRKKLLAAPAVPVAVLNLPPLAAD